MFDIRIFSSPLNIQSCIDAILSPQSGCVDIFIGTVRNSTAERQVNHLEYQAYEKMALKEMEKIANDAAKKWPVQKIILHHRTGILKPGEAAVVVAVSAAHRDAAFDACRYIIDTLKKTVPIWKKEVFEGGEEWIEGHP